MSNVLCVFRVTSMFYLLQVGVFLLQLSLLRLRFGQILFLLTSLVLQAGDPSCRRETNTVLRDAGLDWEATGQPSTATVCL